jgi:elongation factor Ts
MITTETVKELRDKTGVSVMQCKKALEEAGGDMEKALMVLRKISSAQAEKKADRTLGGGIIHSYIHSNKKVGVLLELNCETDFVASNEEFVNLANDLALHIAGMAPEFVSPSDINEEEKKKATEFFQEEIASLDKPEEIKAKVLEGKVNDYFKEKVLLSQPFIKNPDLTIEQRINEVVQKTGEKVAVGRFIRYSVLG